MVAVYQRALMDSNKGQRCLPSTMDTQESVAESRSAEGARKNTRWAFHTFWRPMIGHGEVVLT